ncbi:MULTISPECIES: hypothetical protein [unclassified Curtobacterium]|uniref:hypothetical protein n=1 Tax=unclassified Curtobacterium TaxID=257496 RepID=UPI000F49F033|nr:MULTISPECIES: hypothetical protein [unclassified Curtobacterium]NQW92378.1 hypothetical protein [Curtobacterium sp. VKM Ac-2861]ROQ17484.1 hypothetical protein EDF41_0518 [Curtobacterium sp. PhB171]ROQ29271.1 hypothetical protein EDF40_0506 [Curtobacterium sp. PhB170]ROS36483.1 hypothetical protein EDF53_2453 [Curtobacterium sp. PhB78]ROS45585.1 hypothetical protein EDF25_0343 [Curtobacterium sp. PhB131]
MDATARQTLTEEWTARGRSIAAFVTANIPPEVVPVSVFDHAQAGPAAADTTDARDGARP